MKLLTAGRHNEYGKFQLAAGGFLLGVVCFLWLFHFFDFSFASVSDSFWSRFWSSVPGWGSVLLCLSWLLLMITMSRISILGSWIISLFFFLEGMVFSFCTCIMCGTIPDMGVYLALFSTVAPAFFLIFPQLLCISSGVWSRGKLTFCLISVLVCFAVRRWGMQVAGEIYFSSLG